MVAQRDSAVWLVSMLQRLESFARGGQVAFGGHVVVARRVQSRVLPEAAERDLSLEVGDVGARDDPLGDLAAGVRHHPGLELHTEHVTAHRDPHEHQVVWGGRDERLRTQRHSIVVIQVAAAPC